MNIPESVFNKIMQYNSHPVADIVKNSVVFKTLRYKNERAHGCPFDRGSCDAYYGREYCPHKVIERKKNSKGTYYDVKVEEEELTIEELQAYEAGWEYQMHLGYFKNSNF